jgi:glycosyltransferase involved in cell wall biosynthesis
MDNSIDLIVTVFNKDKYIIRAINSGISQFKYKFNKIIIVNDGSSDDSKIVIKKFIKNKSQIELINIKNKGVSFARNLATKHSKAKFVCYLDGDDALDKYYLNEINKLINRYPDCKIFSTLHKNIFSSGDFEKIKNNVLDKSFFNISTNPVKSFIFNFKIICSSGICILKKEIEKFPFPENIKIGEDIFVWLKLFSVNKLAWSSKELILIYKNSLNRAQNNSFYEVPFYLKKKDEIIKLYNSKFWIQFYFFISYFINYFRIMRENKNLIKDFNYLNKNFKTNAYIIRYMPFFLLKFIFLFFLKIRNKFNEGN